MKAGQAMRFECAWFPGAVLGVAFDLRDDERQFYLMLLCLGISVIWRKRGL